MEFLAILIAIYVSTVGLSILIGRLFRSKTLPARIARCTALVVMGTGLVTFVIVAGHTERDAEGIALAGVFLAFELLSLPCWLAYLTVRGWQSSVSPEATQETGFSNSP